MPPTPKKDEEKVASPLPDEVASADYADDVDPRDLQPDDKVSSLVGSSPEARAEYAGINTEGLSTDPDAGQAQIQAFANAIDESGTIPPTGGPPSDALTVSKVVESEKDAKAAQFEAQKEAFKG